MDIGPGSAQAPASLAVWNGQLWFTATTSANGHELWRTDGTAAGTVLAVELVSGSASAGPQDLVAAGNLLFCSLLGYALAKLDFPGRRALFLTVLGMLMVPGMVTFVPQFVLAR